MTTPGYKVKSVAAATADGCCNVYETSSDDEKAKHGFNPAFTLVPSSFVHLPIHHRRFHFPNHHHLQPLLRHHADAAPG